MDAVEKLREEIRNGNSLDRYEAATEAMSTEKKLEFLKEIKRDDLVDVFKDYKPRASRRRKRGAPLDQRVSVTVTKEEKESLEREVANLKKANQKTSMSEIIRNRAVGSVDINNWRDIAEETLELIEGIKSDEKDLRKRRRQHIANMDELNYEKDDEEYALEYSQLKEVEEKLNKITAQKRKSSFRITGRMSLQEAETVKWRAQRLSISAADYLRMMIFDITPNSNADAHMSYDTKRRFYVSILEVSHNGWGTPPEIAHCKQCENYIDEIRVLQERIKQLETFAKI